MYLQMKDLPETLVRALKRAGHTRPDIRVEESETYIPSAASAMRQGNRGFLMVVNLATGETAQSVGAWGGSNTFSQSRVDDDHTERPIPPNGAVILGETGYKPYFRVVVAPGTLAKALPPAQELSVAQKLCLSIIRSLKPFARVDRMIQSNLGPYDVSNPLIQSLIDLGLLKANKIGAIQVTTDGRNVDNLPCYYYRLVDGEAVY